MPPRPLPSWDELEPVQLPSQGAPAPAAASARSAPVLEPQGRSVWERMGDQATDAFIEFSPMAALGRALGTYDPTLSDPEERARLGPQGETDARAARIAADSRANRERIAAREAADPAWREGAGTWDNVGRVAADFTGGMVGGGFGDPTSLVGVGSGSLLRMMAGQFALGGGVDAATQGVEMGQGVRDEFDPVQTGVTAAASAGFVAVPGLVRKGWDAWRGTPAEPGSQDIGDVILDGPEGPAPGGFDVDGTLRSAGYSPDMFSTPELALQMAQRIEASRGRQPNIDPTILAERANAEQMLEMGEMDPAFAPAPLPPRVLPDDVTLQAHPEGAVRSDEVGSLVGLLRNLAANQNVLEQASAAAPNDPAIQAILDASIGTQQKVGPLWQRLEAQTREANAQTNILRQGPLGIDPATEQAPWLRPTPEQARGETEGVILPVQGRITSRFGNRAAPKAGASTNHGGIDIAGAIGDPVAAPRGGTVIAAGEAGNNGNLVRIDHGNGVVTSYAHLDGFDVKIGDRVEPGQVFARVGNTGNSTGPHLHYGLRVNGERVDPETYKWSTERAEEPIWRTSDQGDGPLERGQGPSERMDRQASPTNEDYEQGRWFERRDAPGTFSDQPSAGPAYEAPMGAGDSSRPFKDVSSEQDRPEFRAGEAGPDGQPGGPRPGRSYWEDDLNSRMEEMVREYEASQSKRRERQQRERSSAGANEDPSARYKKHGQKPHQDGDFWRQTDDGMVADKDGNPVAFRNAKEAAKWATSNNMAGDFELHTWETNSARVVLRRRANSTYGTKPAPDPEAPREPGAPPQLEAPRVTEPGTASSPGEPETSGGGGPAPAPAAPSRSLLDDVEGELEAGVTDPVRRADIEEYLTDLTDPEIAASPEVSERAVRALAKLNAPRSSEPVTPRDKNGSDPLAMPGGKKLTPEQETRYLDQGRADRAAGEEHRYKSFQPYTYAKEAYEKGYYAEPDVTKAGSETNQTPDMEQTRSGPQTLGGKADDTYTAADVDPPKPGMKANFDRLDGDDDKAREILDAIDSGLIRDGDMLEMGSPRWALERGYADIGPVDGTRMGRLTEKGRAFLDRINGVEAKPEPKRVKGKRETVVTPANREVETEFEVRELSDVKQATDHRQPRDRGRAASDLQVTKIALELDPEQLHSNRQAAHGAPIIGEDGTIEVGNGRVRALERAYSLHPERVTAYQRKLRDLGYDVEGFERPVLVRRRLTEMDEGEVTKWVNEAQDSGTMGMSAPERAKADASLVPDDVLDLYRGGEIDSAGNRDFVKAWAEATRADGASLRAADGTLSVEGKARIRASILAKAFDDSTLVAKLLGDEDNNIKAIGTVLTDLAPKFAQVKKMAKAGEISAELDISGKIGEMAGLISRARAEGKKLGDLLNTSDMFKGDVDPTTESLVRLMFKDDDLAKPRSGVRLREAFDFYLEDAKAQNKGPGLFGDDVKALGPVDIIEAARAKLDAKDAPHQAGLFKVISERLREATIGLSDKSLKDTLRRLRPDMEPEQRDLADRLLDVIGDDARLTYGHLGDKGGKSIAGQADTEANRVFVARSGDLETMLHETVHLALIKRYGEEFAELRAGDAGASPARELIKLYNDARARHDKYGFWNRKAAGHTVEYALSNIDEFIAEALTSKSFQRWLQRGTIWNRMVDGFRKVLGLPARFKPMLDDALRSGRGLLEAVAKDSSGSVPRVNAFGRKGRVDKLVDKDGLIRDAEAIRRIVGDPKAAATALARRLKDGVAWAMYSNDAKGRMVADRIESDAANELLDHFFARPGMYDGKTTDRTFHEAVQRYAAGRSQEAFRALEGIIGNEAAERRVADLLRFPKRTNRATPAELEAAKKLRQLFKDTIDYRKAAGEEIGEVADGYFPRWLNVETVLERSDEFLEKASKLYRDMGDSPKVAKDNAQRWLEHIVDTYAGIDAGLDLYNAAGDTVGSRTAKAREFGKQADALLADFYQNDVMAVASQYFHGAARKSEIARRFGAKGAVDSPERKKWIEQHGEKTQLEVLEDRIREDARKHGAEGAGSMGVLRSIYSSNLGRLQANMSNRQRAAVSWAHTWTQLGVMDRATITSLAELMGGFTRGGLRRGLPFVADSLKQYVRQLRNAAPDDAQRWAEAIGVANDAMVNQSLAARANIEGGTERSQKVLTGFYHATTLHQFTEGTRIAAVKMGRELLRQWSHDMTSSSARVSTRAKKYLAEVGVHDPEAFAKAVREDTFGLEDVSRETSEGAKDYATALIRLTNQTIMRPTRAEKPSWANHPVGGMFFSLMSYSYGFKKNVLDRAGRLAVKGFETKDPTLLMPAMGLALMTAFQGIMDTHVRPAIFGGGPSEDETPMEQGLRIADRAGLTGALSPIVNAITGVKYQRGLAESLAGPVIGRPLDFGTKFAALAINNGKGNTAERNAAGAVYDNVVEPGMDGLAAARLGGVVRSAAVLGTGTRDDKGALPSDREAFISAIAGAKKGD